MTVTDKQAAFLDHMTTLGTNAGLTETQANMVAVQAALESNWGKQPHGSNYWGITGNGDSGTTGLYALYSTEAIAYGTPGGGAWTDNPGYLGVLYRMHNSAYDALIAEDPEAFFQELRTPPVWAADPDYTAKLTEIWNRTYGSATPLPTPSGTYNNPTNPIPVDQLPTEVPTTYTNQESIVDQQSAETEEMPSYIKLTTVNKDVDPTGIFTAKISDNCELLLLREKINNIIKASDVPVASAESTSSLYNNEDAPAPTSRDINVPGKTTATVEKSGSYQLHESSVMIDYHNNGYESGSVTLQNRIILNDIGISIRRAREGEVSTYESLLLGDDKVQLYLIKDKYKNKLELTPEKVLIKNQDDSIISMQEDKILLEVKIPPKGEDRCWIYIHGDQIYLKNGTGSFIMVRGDTISAVNDSGCMYRAKGEVIDITAPSAIHIDAPIVTINGTALVVT